MTLRRLVRTASTLTIALLLASCSNDDPAVTPAPDASADSAPQPDGPVKVDADAGADADSQPASVIAWAKRFGGDGEDVAHAVATDADGNVYITGTFASATDFGGGVAPCTIGQHIFIASYSAGGAHRWSKTFDCATHNGLGTGIAIDASGNVYVTGAYSPTPGGAGLDLGGGPLGGQPGATTIFVASFSAAGAHRWSKGFAGDVLPPPTVAADPSGNVYVTGGFRDTVDFGGGALTFKGSSSGFIASFSAAGAHRWSKAFGGSGLDFGAGVATDASGNVYLTGRFTNTVDFGGGPLTTSNGDAFVASFGAAGDHRWSKGLGQTSAQGQALTIDTAGNVYIAGFGFTAPSGGRQEAFLASFSAAGEPRWSKDFAGSSATGVASGRGGDVTITGSAVGSDVDFGGGPLSAKAPGDMFVARFSASGAHRWSKVFGGAGLDVGHAAAGHGDDVYVTGRFAGSVDFGAGALTAKGPADIILLKVQP